MKLSILSGTLITCLVSIGAAPLSDPVCGTPSSLDLVQSIRLKMASNSRAQANRVSALQVESSPRISIERRNSPDLPRLIFSGTAGKNYDVEATSSLGSPNWQSLLSLTLGGDPLKWDDLPPGTAPLQFFRLREGNPEPLTDSASNFRLIDHQGTARDLFYNTHMLAMVVVSAGTNLDQVTSLTPTFDELSKTYSNRIQIWILLSGAAPIRSNLVTQTKQLNINFPVLSDPEGIAARSIGLTRAGEVALIRPPDFTISYRGTVAGSGQTDAAQTYLGRALENAISNQPLAFRRTTAAGAFLNHIGASTPSYSEDVAPVLYKYCANCHRPNSVAPFAMTNYSVIAEWAPTIKHALVSRHMPPWHADPEYGHFANDLSLPEEHRAALVRWIDAGALRGSGADPLAELPIQKGYEEIPSELGEPDQIVTVPLQQIKATGTEPYRYIFVQTSNTSNVWLRAAIVRHSTYPAVHHSLVWLGKIGNIGTTSSSYNPYIAEYVPGYKPYLLPTNSYMLLSKSNWLTFNLHYNTINVATNDQPVLYLWYHKTKPPRTFVTHIVGNDTFTIKPGAADFQVQAEVTFSNNPVTLFRLNPHMHLRGKRMKFEAIYPGGRREILLSVPDYDFMWQIGYQLAEPKILPTGTRVVISGAFDNSPQNLFNPDPSATVRWGDQSWMEMFAGFLEYSQ